jgi:Flp pilus assembly protein TadG
MNALNTRNPAHRPALVRSRGAVVVELTFVTIVLLLIVAGAVGFGRTFWYADALAKAARDGARLMSTWPAATIATGGVVAAQDQVAAIANAANISPAITSANVNVECLDATFTAVGCVDGTEPEFVRVAITDFSVSIDAWFPIFSWTGRLTPSAINLSPQTLMRYML